MDSQTGKHVSLAFFRKVSSACSSSFTIPLSSENLTSLYEIFVRRLFFVRRSQNHISLEKIKLKISFTFKVSFETSHFSSVMSKVFPGYFLFINKSTQKDLKLFLGFFFVSSLRVFRP